MTKDDAEELMFASVQGYGPTRDKLLEAIKDAAQRCESSLEFPVGETFHVTEQNREYDKQYDEPAIARLLVRDFQGLGYVATINLKTSNVKTTKLGRYFEMDCQWCVNVRW